jgi:hypothetical protein
MRPRLRVPGSLLASLAVASVAGCAALAPPDVTTAPGTTNAPATGAPTTRPTPVPSPTPSPRPQAQLEIGRTFVKVWEDNVTGSLEYQVVVEARNIGTVAADFGTSKREYRLLDAIGGIVDEGTFTYALPPVIQPGGVAYFIDSDEVREGLDPRAVSAVEADLVATTTDEPVPLFPAANVTIAQAEVGSGLRASGSLTNPTGQPSLSVVVGVVFFNAADAIIGAVLDNYSVRTVAAGSSVPFETQDLRSPPLTPASVDHFTIVAYDAGF